MSISIESHTELVVTIPEPFAALLAYRTRCRSTIGVLVQLIAKAERHIIIAAPFMQSGYGLSSGVLEVALRSSLKRGVNVDLLSTEQSLKTIGQSLQIQNAPGKLQFFHAAAHLEDEKQLGSHAKFCLVDAESAYVGSANLTGRGLSDQIEMGILVHGNVAHQMGEFWDYAIELGLIVSV